MRGIPHSLARNPQLHRAGVQRQKRLQQVTSNTSSDFPPQRKLYGPMLEPHHVWCNHQNRIGPCSQCDRLYSLYPVTETDSEDDLIRKHFPHAQVR